MKSLNLLALSILLFEQTFLAYPPIAQADSNQVIELNNDGVRALNTGNIQLAIQKFDQALKLDPNYQLAKDNLAIAHNNYGLELRSNPKAAIKEFHQAYYLNPNNKTTQSNLAGIISMMGKDPHDFSARVQLGDDARKSGDMIGAIIEYSEALKIKDDRNLHITLGDLYRVQDNPDQALNQYKIATLIQDDSDVEVKIGQAYQAKSDIPNAIQAYTKAIAFKPDDTDVQDALYAGWEAALMADPLAPENHIGLAQALEYRGDFQQAKQELLQALKFAQQRNSASAAQTAQKLLDALPAAQHRAQSVKHINTGVDLQSRKLYDQAIDEYNIALQADPNNASILVNIGTAYQAKGDFASAIDKYQQALRIDPNNTAAQQGIQTATAQNQEKQLKDISSAGDDLFKQGKYDEAIQKYKQLIEINPKNAAAHFDLAATYQAENNLDLAINEYNNALAYDPTNDQYKKALNSALDLKAKPIIDQAVKEHQNKNYAQAVDLYQQALALCPNNASVWFNMAAAEYARQNYPSAKKDYTQALKLDHANQVDDLYFIATIDENNGQGTDALYGYKQYLTEAPKGNYANAAAARVAALSKDITATIRIKTEAELAQIQEAAKDYQQAVQLQQQQRFDEALPLYQQAIQLQPKEASYAYALGTLYQQKNDIAQAINWYQQAHNLDPNNKDYLNALATVNDIQADALTDQAVQKQTSGDISSAITLYKQALTLSPNNARLWTNIGTAYQQSDQFKDAQGAYQKGFDLDNKNEVGNLYLIGAINENYDQGTLALANYKKYLQLAPTGQYAAAAKDRIKALNTDIMAVQKLKTASQLKAFQEAQEVYNQAVQAQQNNNLDQAITLYQKAIEIAPKEAAYPYALGTAYQAKNDLDNAISAYQKAISLAPLNSDYQKVYAAAKQLKATAQDQAKADEAGAAYDQAIQLQQQNKLDEALVLYQKAIAAQPNESSYYYGIGTCYMAKNDIPQAIINYKKAISLKPQEPSFKQALKQATQIQAAPLIDSAIKKQTTPGANGKYDLAGAITDYEAALKIDDDANTHLNLGTAYQANNNLPKAASEYKLALQMNAGLTDAHYYLGTIYDTNRQIAPAILEYQKYLKLAPNGPNAADARNRLKALGH